MEAVINAKPDVIIDMGEKKKGIEEDLNKLQDPIKNSCSFHRINS